MVTLVTEAFRPVIGLITPRLFGPMIRIRPRLACPMIRRSSSAPSAPISLNPPEAMMAAQDPGRDTFADQVGHRWRGRGHDGQIDRVGHVPDAGMGFDPQHCAAGSG